MPFEEAQGAAESVRQGPKKRFCTAFGALFKLLKSNDLLHGSAENLLFGPVFLVY